MFFQVELAVCFRECNKIIVSQVRMTGDQFERTTILNAYDNAL